jgi:hypothetical protein
MDYMPVISLPNLEAMTSRAQYTLAQSPLSPQRPLATATKSAVLKGKIGAKGSIICLPCSCYYAAVKLVIRFYAYTRSRRGLRWQVKRAWVRAIASASEASSGLTISWQA